MLMSQVAAITTTLPVTLLCSSTSAISMTVSIASTSVGLPAVLGW